MAANKEAGAAENSDASIDVPPGFISWVVWVPSEDKCEPERLYFPWEVPEKKGWPSEPEKECD
jgi:hypothetical protein